MADFILVSRSLLLLAKAKPDFRLSKKNAPAILYSRGVFASINLVLTAPGGSSRTSPATGPSPTACAAPTP